MTRPLFAWENLEDSPSEAMCNAGKAYGKTVRVACTMDVRRFPPIPRATKKFDRLYRGRTSMERVNARLKIFWGVDDGNITGARRFHGMVVHLAFATALAAAPRRAGIHARRATASWEFTI